MIHKYLLDEPPLVILPSLATLIGLNEAIVLQQVHYWVANAREAKRTANYRAGRWWVYHSYPEWGKTFPFWSEPTIKRTFLGLEKAGLLLTGLHSNDPRDRSKWYTVDYEALQRLVEKQTGSECADAPDQFDPVDSIKMIPSTGSNWHDAPDQPNPMHRIKSGRCIEDTDTTTKTTTDTTTKTTANHLPQPTSSHESGTGVVVAFSALLVEELITLGITKVIAKRLAGQYPEDSIRKQMEALPYRKCEDPAATLVRAIQEAWEPPASARKPRSPKRILVASGATAQPVPLPTEENKEALRNALAAARKKTKLV